MTTDEPRFVRMDEIAARVGVHKATIRRMEARGQFPAGRRIGLRCVVWRSDEVDAWIAAQ